MTKNSTQEKLQNRAQKNRAWKNGAQKNGAWEKPAEKTVDFGFQEVPVQEKADRVRGVFESVAPSYDMMNDAMSMGVHRLWKDLTITKLNPQPGELLIDVAGGTGDLARRFIQRADDVRLRRGGARATAIICAIHVDMLQAGVDAKKDAGLELSRVCADAQSLPFMDHEAEAVTIAFGIRNVTDRLAALVEFHRILKPGGRLFVLEFSTPTTKALRDIYDAYSFNLIPKLGGWLANDADSYQYLVESIRQFPRQQAFADMIQAAGFSRVAYHNFSGGIAALHWGWKV